MPDPIVVCLDRDALVTNLVAGGMVALGMVYLERNTDSDGKRLRFKLIANALFVSGWVLFLMMDESNAWPFGLLVPFVSLFIQFYLNVAVRQSREARRSMMSASIALIGMLFGTWVFYLSRKQADSLSWTGMSLVLIGMAWYYKDRRYALLFAFGLEEERGDKLDAFELFHPGVVMIGIGWSMLAVDNSLISTR